MEKFKKNRFWIMLPLVVILWVVSFFSIQNLSSATSANWTKAESAYKGVQGIGGGKIINDKWVEAVKKLVEEEQALKQSYWIEAYDNQNGVVREEPKPAAEDGGKKPARGKIVEADRIIKWPLQNAHREILNWKVEVGQPPYPSPWDMDFGEPLSTPTRPIPQQYQTEYYRSQFTDLVKIVNPLNEATGDGVVRFLGSGAGSMPGEFSRAPMGPTVGTEGYLNAALAVLKPRPLTQYPRIVDKEVWLLQEEIGIKRELLKIIHEANEAVAVLQPEWREVPIPESRKKEEKKRDTEEAASAPVPTSPSEEASAKKDEEEKKPAGPIDRRRFLNNSWHIGAPEATGLKTDYFNAWVLDLSLLPEESGTKLKGVSINYSRKAIPDMTLDVIVTDGAGREQRVPLKIEGMSAGAPHERNPQATKPAKKVVESEQKPPVGSQRIVSVQRRPESPALDHQRFLNPYWLVDIQLVPASGGAAVKGRIHNISGERRRPVDFEVKVFDDRQTLFVEDFTATIRDPVNAGEDRLFQTTLKKGRPQQLVSVRQKIDWQSAPIKRIDAVEMGHIAHAPSDRTKIQPLKTYEEMFKKKNPTAVSETTSDAGAPSSPPGGPGNPGGPMGMQPSGMMSPSGRAGAGGETGPKTPGQGIPEERYVEVSEELRRIPVALVLVVDQAHINDVTAAVVNSRLRIQVTQVTWVRTSLPPPAFITNVARPEGGTGILRRTEPFPVTAGQNPVPTEEESSLVELQIYGQAVIYENPDAEAIRKQRTEAAGQTTPGTPPGM